MNNIVEGKRRIIKYIPYILVGLTFVILLIRRKYSFCQSDESYYLALTDRLWRGEQMIIDEWSPNQYYAVIWLPFYALFRMIVPSGEGVIYYGRVIYSVISLIISIYSIKVLQKKYSLFTVSIIGVIIMLYNKENIEGMSYYGLFFLFSWLFCICFLDVISSEKEKISLCKCVIGGWSGALAVLCNPFFALVIVAFMVVGICNKRRRRMILFYMIGILLAALVFVVFFMPKDFGKVVENLYYNFADPRDEHETGIIGGMFINFYKLCYQFFVSGLLVIINVILITVRKLVWNKVDRWIKIGTYVNMLIIIFMNVSWPNPYDACTNTYLSYYGIALSGFLLIVLTCAIDGNVKRNRELIGTYLVGLGMIISFAMASDGQGGTGAGAAVCSMASIMYADCVIRAEDMPFFNEKSRRVFVIFGMVACVSIVFTHFVYKIVFMYRSEPLQELTCELEYGLAKGLFVSEYTAGEYASVCGILDDINEKYSEDDGILFIKLMPWAYVYSELKYSAPTSWRIHVNENTLQDYYLVNPAKLPSVIVVFKPLVGRTPDLPLPNQIDETGWIMDYLQDKGTVVMENDVATVYEIKDVKDF